MGTRPLRSATRLSRPCKTVHLTKLLHQAVPLSILSKVVESDQPSECSLDWRKKVGPARGVSLQQYRQSAAHTLRAIAGVFVDLHSDISPVLTTTSSRVRLRPTKDSHELPLPWALWLLQRATTHRQCRRLSVTITLSKAIATCISPREDQVLLQSLMSTGVACFV